MKKLLYLTSLISVISCSTDSQQHAEKNISESVIDTTSISGSAEGSKPAIMDLETLDQQSDTLVLDKKSVIFFMLNQQEYDSLMVASGDDATDINEGFSDFSHYAGIVSQKMQEKGINSDVVAHKVFKIVTTDGIKYYDRKAVPDADMGVIIFDGKTNPTIETGVMSDVDFLMLIDEKIK